MILLQLLLLVATSILPAHAHESEEITDLDPPGQPTLNLNHFQAVGLTTMVMDGKFYDRISFDFKPEYQFHVRDALLLGNIAATGAAAYGVIAWNPRQDEVRHFLAGYVVGNVANASFQLILPQKMKHRRLVSALLGFGTGALIGAAKEVYDAQGYGRPSVNDALITAAGGGVGTLTMTFDLKKVFKRTSKQAPTTLIE